MVYELEVVLTATTAIFAAITFWIGRRVSERAEMRATERELLRKQMKELLLQCDKANQTIGDQEAQIVDLKDKLEQKDKKIAELQDRLKFAEKVSERDLERIRGNLLEIRANLQSIIKTHEELERKEK